MRRTCLVPLLASLALGMGACGPTDTQHSAKEVTARQGGAASVEDASRSSGPAVTAASKTVTPVLAVGDIAGCDTDEDEKVAALARERAGTIIIPGDAVYEQGTPQEYQECFHPAWGAEGMYGRLRPAPGNHDYETEGAAGYHEYFADRTRRPGRGWYAFNLGPHWRGIVLNTQCRQVGCAADSPQGRWLRRALARAAADRRHVLAVFHRPRFSTGQHGSSTSVRPFFRLLYRARVPLAIVGHDHMYERFAPQNATGDRRRHGVRQFTVGTGGRSLHAYSRGPLPNTQVRNNSTFGLLELRLRADGYRWQFLATRGSFEDRGGTQLPVR